MSDKFYVGLDLTGFENNGIQRPISRVTLKLDDENILTAGNDTGFELVADCPHATQAMVNSILAQVKGFQYKMYDASDINIDPSMELGDGITASGVYSVISRVDDDGSGFPSASAPGVEELEDEYPTGGPMTQEFNRKIAETRSRITKTAEQIRLEVEHVNDSIVDLSASFSVELGKITSTVQDINGDISKLEQTLNGFSLSVENGSTSSTIKLMAGEAVISSESIKMNGLVTFQGLSDGTTTIDGGCIKTGSIESIRINSSSISGGTITGTAISGGSLTSVAPDNFRSTVIKDGIIRFYEQDQEVGSVSSFSGMAGIVGKTAAALSVNGTVTGAALVFVTSNLISFGQTYDHLFSCENNIDLHSYSILNTSDARLKANIRKSDIKSLDIINAIQTYSFDWKENGQHENLGFIAQQLEEINSDFVNINPTDGHYSTKDLKLIPYLVKAVQELSAQLNQLKGVQK